LGVQAGLQSHLVSGAAPAQIAPSHSRVFALTVLTDDDPVEVGAFGLAEGRLDSRKEGDGTNVRPLVERLGDRQAKAPQAGVVGHLGGAYRPEVDGVVPLQLDESAVRDVVPVVQEVPGIPGELSDVEI